jgi:hypothetical protein
MRPTAAQKACPGSAGGHIHGHVYTRPRVKRGAPRQSICLYCDKPCSTSELDAAARHSLAMVEARKMLAAISRDVPQFFRMGRMRANKPLVNGYRCIVEIVQRGRRSKP